MECPGDHIMDWLFMYGIRESQGEVILKSDLEGYKEDYGECSPEARRSRWEVM